MQSLPQRLSLVTQTEDILIQGIRTGHWRQRLPGERPLCQELQVSRWTLRAALAGLARRKLLRIHHGRSCEIIGRIRSQQAPDQPWRLGWIVAEPLVELRPHTILMLEEIRGRLHQAGGELDLYHRPKFYLTNSARLLADFVAQNPHDAWVIGSTTRPMQRWLKRQGLPVLVSGLHEGIQLPSINLDYYGAGRHAAGVLLGRGHRRAAVMRSNRGVPSVHIGASELARGFCDVFAISPRAHLDPVVVVHSGETNTVCRILNRLLDLPEPPTALLIGDSATFLIAITHLAQRRIKIPEEMSLIVAEDEPYFSRILPAPAHYEWPLDSFLQHWLRLFRKIRKGSLSDDTCVRVVPRFIPGGTVASYRG